ncbi:pentatricopeptide repeat-containing protein At1g32415, mitochondrial-like [Selaginella moellendorffii]|uniref:pentatricopeptide repeat-containing protein At1g32415, mitochondrial-like n=1 Tax=Selaginella moellendorffii TaxID=88036 RepID=UPI000D1C3FC7|nr:pentatricopeptide repeat-containing protein At1g32415, mitochondrial-like [Selaginella moellendorffii]|eukprot:XP_024516018.1 pentatricopeptide repeat-containing protein At1g32415, mitochondrial-like [Selaginella moellendorffii]
MADHDIVSWKSPITLIHCQAMIDRVPERQAVIWNSMITALAQGQNEAAKSIFDRMPAVSWTNLLLCYAQNDSWKNWTGRSIGSPSPTQCVGEESSLVELLLAYAENGHFDGAVRFFHEIPHKTIVCWTALMQIYVNLGHLGTARSVIKSMKMLSLGRRALRSSSGSLPSYESRGRQAGQGDVPERFNFVQPLPRAGSTSSQSAETLRWCRGENAIAA